MHTTMERMNTNESMSRMPKACADSLGSLNSVICQFAISQIPASICQHMLREYAQKCGFICMDLECGYRGRLTQKKQAHIIRVLQSHMYISRHYCPLDSLMLSPRCLCSISHKAERARFNRLRTCLVSKSTRSHYGKPVRRKSVKLAWDCI